MHWSLRTLNYTCTAAQPLLAPQGFPTFMCEFTLYRWGDAVASLTPRMTLKDALGVGAPTSPAYAGRASTQDACSG